MSVGTMAGGIAKKAFNNVTNGVKETIAYRKAEEVKEAEKKVAAAKEGKFDGGVVADVVDAVHDVTMNTIDFTTSAIGAGPVASKVAHTIKKDLNVKNSKQEHKSEKAANGVDKRTVDDRASALVADKLGVEPPAKNKNKRFIPFVSNDNGQSAQTEME